MQWFKSCSERADGWQAQAERLALIAPTVITAPAPVAPETPAAAPEPPRRSLLRWWFGVRVFIPDPTHGEGDWSEAQRKPLRDLLHGFGQKLEAG